MKAIDLSKVELGQKLWMCDNHGIGALGFDAVVVVRVLPSGMFDVLYDNPGATMTTRFNADGSERARTYRKAWIDIDTDMTYDERAAYIAKNKRAREAAQALTALVGREKHGRITEWWEPNTMHEVLDKLQGELVYAIEKPESRAHEATLELESLPRA